MGERAEEFFPFVIAVILPPAGLFLGLFNLKDERDLAIRLIVVSVLAAVVWAFLFLA